MFELVLNIIFENHASEKNQLKNAIFAFRL